jgi:hypothetical protein
MKALLIAQWPVIACIALYLTQATKQASARNWPMAGMWTGYAFSNVALLFAQS